MIITLAGKGGSGKTSLCALLLDELARTGYPGPVLAVDGDPAPTLHLALGLPEPPTTVAQVRDTTELNARTIRQLPDRLTSAGYMAERLQAAGVITSHRLRAMSLDLIAIGQGEGPGCYCRVNQALATVLPGLVEKYPLVLIDNEASLEHLSRYRLSRADLLLVVTTPAQAAQAVARRIVETAAQVQLVVGETWRVFNQAPPDFRPSPHDLAVVVPRTGALTRLEALWHPVVGLAATDTARAALKPLVERVWPCV